MSAGEQGSRGPEQDRLPDIRFVVADERQIEWLSRQDEGWVPLTYVEDAPYPLKKLMIEIDGSSEKRGVYSLRTQMRVNIPEAEDDQRHDEFFDNFAEEHEAEPLDRERSGYLITTPLGYQYLFSIDSDNYTYTLETAGVNDGKSRLEKRAKAQLFHATEYSSGAPEFHESVKDFLTLNERLVTYLYQQYEAQNVHLKVLLQPFESATPVEAPLDVLQISGEQLPGLQSLGGISAIKDELMEAVTAIQYPEVFKAYLLEQPHGIFLHGPPGTGKTSLAKALAGELGADLRMVRSSDIYGMWMGESERNLQKIFDDARAATRPLVLLFDEVDGIVRPEDDSAYATVASLFKQQIGLLSEANPNVLPIATSNKQPSHIDEALFRPGRFDKHIYVPLPNEKDREDIFLVIIAGYMENASRNIFLNIPVADYAEFARATEDMSGQDIKGIIQRAVTPLALYELRTGKPGAPLTREDILHAINVYRSKKA